jgi:two-component system phosphate regulon sensor histidine kinase PhoR
MRLNYPQWVIPGFLTVLFCLLAVVLSVVLLPAPGELLWFILVSLAVGISTLWLVLWLLVFRRINALYARLLAIRQRRLPDVSVQRDPDPLYGIGRTVLELTGTLRQELAEMREAEVVRKEFIGDISHELKTPIFAIQGFLETLLDGAMDDPEVNRKFLEKALNNSFRLSNLVQDLLVVTQLEAGHLKMDIRAFRVYELMLDVVDAVTQRAHTLGYADPNIRVNCKGLEKAVVLADRERMFQVMSNLLDNALKYGDSGTVSLNLEPRNGSKLLVSVVNDGPGIPEADLPHIFDRFYRVEKSRARNLGGNGLGLSIVKNLVEAHEETIAVRSKPGETVFSFTLTTTQAN